jgi:polyferredoxin
VQATAFLIFLGLFFYTCWPYTASPSQSPGEWPTHYSDDLAAKGGAAAELFLWLDPLVGLSGAIAARLWNIALWGTVAVLLFALLFPRGFCGYLCPLGTLIDVVDRVLSRPRPPRLRPRLRWRMPLLLCVLSAAAGGLVLSGFLAPIPVLTRGLLSTLGALQLGVFRGWHQVPPPGTADFLSIALLLAIAGLCLLGPRFWCRHLCPTGALFSLLSSLRLRERRLTADCARCGRCVEICSFDAIHDDFTTRTGDCAFCQTCGGICPNRAIRFEPRWREKPVLGGPRASPLDRAITRRGFFTGVATGMFAALGVQELFGADLDDPDARRPVRPPMSVPERDFLRLCIRCGECIQACPNRVLQPIGFEQGLEGLWTPRVAADWSGCDPSCHNCGQVCPTGAVRALPLEEKRAARMGLAVVDAESCLPWAGRDDCQLCRDECEAAGYRAIEFERIGVELDSDGFPVEGTGNLAPVVRPDLCVGCGLCQSVCFRINHRHKGLLERSAVVIAASPGTEDRLYRGSYVELRRTERERKDAIRRQREEKLLEELEGRGLDEF